MAKKQPESPKNDTPLREMIVIYHPVHHETKHVTPTEWESHDGELAKQGWQKQ